eukprot:2081999-Ditylum_brightwellii.AAC.1
MEQSTSPIQLQKGPLASNDERDRNVAELASKDTSTKHLSTTPDSATGGQGAVSNQRSSGDDRLGRF